MSANDCANCKYSRVRITEDPCKSCCKRIYDMGVSYTNWVLTEEPLLDTPRCCCNCEHTETGHSNCLTCCSPSKYGFVAKYAATVAPIAETVKPAEPDYSFNQSIIDAMKDQKPVWLFSGTKWIEITAANQLDYNLRSIYNYKWSLTCPTKPDKPKKLYVKSLGKLVREMSFKTEQSEILYQHLNKVYSIPYYYMGKEARTEHSDEFKALFCEEREE